MNVVVTNAKGLLAATILAAVKAREDSYDKAASEKDKAEAEATNAGCERGDHSNQAFIDFSRYYRLSLRQAVESVATPDLVEPVYLLLYHSWNDAVDWAQSILGQSLPAKVTPVAPCSIEHQVREAIADYHSALDNRAHGGVAADVALSKIQDALNMPWRQGASLKPKAGTVEQKFFSNKESSKFDDFVSRFLTARSRQVFSSYGVHTFDTFMVLQRQEVLRWACAGLGTWNHIERAQDIYRGGCVTNDGLDTKLKTGDIVLRKGILNGSGRCLRLTSVGFDGIQAVDWNGGEYQLDLDSRDLWLLPSATKLVHWLDVVFDYTKKVQTRGHHTSAHQET